MSGLQTWVSRISPPLSRRRVGCIGMDFSLRRLHMVQFFRRRQGDLALQSQVCVEYPVSRDELLASPALLRKVIQRGFSLGRFEGRKVVLGMPGGQFRTVPLNYRSSPHRSDDEVIAQKMLERLDGDIADYVMDYIPVRAEARDAEKLAIVAVSNRQDVTAFLNAMREAQLDVEALEISPVAIRRLTSALPGERSDLVLIVNTGHEQSFLTMLSGRRLLMDQAVNFGETRLLQTLSTTLDIPTDSAWRLVQRTGLAPVGLRPPVDHREGETGIYNTLSEILRPEFQHLVEETDRAFMYAAAQARGGGSARILLFGSLARWPGADKILSQMTDMPVTTLANPLNGFGELVDAEDRAVSEPAFAVAAGLALRGLIDDE